MDGGDLMKRDLIWSVDPRFEGALVCLRSTRMEMGAAGSVQLRSPLEAAISGQVAGPGRESWVACGKQKRERRGGTWQIRPDKVLMFENCFLFIFI
jgi:hypothetical protein